MGATKPIMEATVKTNVAPTVKLIPKRQGNAIKQTVVVRWDAKMVGLGATVLQSATQLVKVTYVFNIMELV